MARNRLIVSLQVVPADDDNYRAEYIVCADGTAWMRAMEDGDFEYGGWMQIPNPVDESPYPKLGPR